MKSSRREFFQTLGTGTAGFGLATALPLASCATAGNSGGKEPEQILFLGDDIALVETTLGKVKGYILRDIYYFLGIPYGAGTSGKNRFMMPRKPEPWTDVFPAVFWGDYAPQLTDNKYANKYQSFQDNWNYYDGSENCLSINVFTPGYGNGEKRPVMVWLHGGGFTAGNSIEQDGYLGENFARFGDVVFCSVNHRLGPMGFTNLAGVGGEKYAASGNVGMLDIVAALEWVHENISAFGGDPDNVTIMGQSGGGAKVGILTAMPSAEGLFHKAVILSGASLRSGEKEYSEQLGAAVLREAGLDASQIDRLQEMPWMDYYLLANRAAQKLNEELGVGGMGLFRGFSPVVDGEYLPQHPFDPEAAPTAAQVPLMICSTLNEMSPSRDNPELENITLEEVKERVSERAGFSAGLGEKAGEVVDAYAKAFPDKKPVEIWSMISSNRKNTVDLADAKARQQAPVYVAWFGWQPPNFNGRQRAFHCSDISFWYYNTDVMITHSGGGARPKRLSEKMAGALARFMNTGNPNGGGLPDWPQYSTENGELMFLDDEPEVQLDPDREARKSLPG